jgi:hypothetical protein
MALQSLFNKSGLVVFPIPFGPHYRNGVSSSSISAAGHYVAYVGQAYLSSGPGTSKVFSSSGAKVHWRSNSATFANAGTTLRVGIQDVTAAGIPDGTFDVYADVVGGASLNTLSPNATSLTTGTKTIAHGDIIAVVVGFTARAGSDSIPVVYSDNNSSSAGFPYCAVNSGAGFGITERTPVVTIESDDGTIGWLGMDSWAFSVDGLSVNSGSTPDEYALVFQVPFKGKITSLLGFFGVSGTSADYELSLYSDPTGTPTVMSTFTGDASYSAQGGTSQRIIEGQIAAQTINPLTDYAIALRPTTANNNFIPYLNFGTSAARGATMLGTNWALGTRSNQTGAFSITSSSIPLLGARFSEFDDGVGGGGGGTRSYSF